MLAVARFVTDLPTGTRFVAARTRGTVTLLTLMSAATLLQVRRFTPRSLLLPALLQVRRSTPRPLLLESKDVLYPQATNPSRKPSLCADRAIVTHVGRAVLRATGTIVMINWDREHAPLI